PSVRLCRVAQPCSRAPVRNGGSEMTRLCDRPVSRPTVAVVGGGFAGLEAARALDGKPVDVVLIDARNHHLFTPLLYQVATALLAPPQIAVSLRSLFRHSENVRIVQDRSPRCGRMPGSSPPQTARSSTTTTSSSPPAARRRTSVTPSWPRRRS